MTTTKEVNFRFVSLQGSDDGNDRNVKRQARSHAIKQALESKRKLQQASGLNFRLVSFEKNPRRQERRMLHNKLEAKPSRLSNTRMDSVHMLVAESSMLQTWLRQNKTGGMAEPIFSIADELVLPNFRSIFRTGFGDPALLNAAMLTFVFAATRAIDLECLRYQSQALTSIRARMSTPEKAASETTLSAILLLAGIDTRLTMPVQVQVHLNAVRQLLSICQGQGIHLTDGIKRAIFWQDLNSSVMTGSERIVDHTTFSELRWSRDSFTPYAYILPSGFQEMTHLLSEAFIEVLKDIHALQLIRDHAHFPAEDVMSMRQIDNHQASIQSRLHGLVNSPNTCQFLESCHLAAYLCSTTLRCKLWPASVVPSHLSSQLLHKLQETTDMPVWDTFPDLLVWLLHIGGAFAPIGEIRLGYVELLHWHQTSRVWGQSRLWSEVLGVLKKFFWSEKAFLSPVKQFWEESFI